MKHRKVHMIYMAAGNSRRFQGNKLLYTISGKALYRYGLETLIEVQKNYPDTTLTVVVQDGQFMTVCGKKIFMLYIIRTVKMEPPIPLKQVSWHWKMCDLRIL